MNLKDMLGEDFREDMTIDEINTFLSGKKFADLSTGKYVDANKYKTDIEAKNTEISNIKNDLNARLTDSEKAAASMQADKLRIQELEDIIKNQTTVSNRDKAESITSDVRSILGISSDDVDYSALLDSLAKVENDKVRSLSTFVNKIAKDSYEKGKKDASKDNLGSFSNGVGKDGDPKKPK